MLQTYIYRLWKKTSGYACDQFQKLVTFTADLKNSRQAPASPEAKSFLKKTLPLIRIAGSKMPWSPTERKGEMHKLFANGAQRYGRPSCFLI